MIKQVQNADIVPDDIKELLLPDSGEYVAIGTKLYEMKPFPIKKYFELLSFISKYHTIYNDVYEMNPQIKINNFLSKLAGQLLTTGIVDEFMNKMFPEIPDASDVVTYDQLTLILGVIYKLNFLSKNRQIQKIQNMETRMAIQQMNKMLGLMNQTENN